MHVLKCGRLSSDGSCAFTLVEVVMAIFLTGLVFGGILIAYTNASFRAEWSGRSLAAESLAIQQIEQARCADWNQATFTNQTTNLSLSGYTYLGNGTVTGYCWSTLDLPSSGSNYIYATNLVCCSLITGKWNNAAFAPATLRMIRVDTVWPFSWRGSTHLYTNTVCTYVAPKN